MGFWKLQDEIMRRFPSQWDRLDPVQQKELSKLLNKLQVAQVRTARRWGVAAALGQSLSPLLPVFLFYMDTPIDARLWVPLNFLTFGFMSCWGMSLMNKAILVRSAARLFVYFQLPFSIINLCIGTIFSYAGSYRILGIIDKGVPSTSSESCLYFSVVTWTTLGYGEIYPSAEARMYAASEALVGTVATAMLIACFTYIISAAVRDQALFDPALPKLDGNRVDAFPIGNRGRDAPN